MCQKFKSKRNLFIDPLKHDAAFVKLHFYPRISAPDWAFTSSTFSAIFKNWKWHKQMMPIHLSPQKKEGKRTHKQIFIVIDRFSFRSLTIFIFTSLSFVFMRERRNFLSISPHSNLIVVSTFIMMSRRNFFSSFFHSMWESTSEKKSFHSIIWKLMIARLKSFVITYRFAPTEPIYKFSSERERSAFFHMINIRFVVIIRKMCGDFFYLNYNFV